MEHDLRSPSRWNRRAIGKRLVRRLGRFAQLVLIRTRRAGNHISLSSASIGDDASNIVSMSGGKLVFYSQDFFVDRVGFHLKLRLFHQDYRLLLASRKMTDHGCFNVNSRLAHESSSPNN